MRVEIDALVVLEAKGETVLFSCFVTDNLTIIGYPVGFKQKMDSLKAKYGKRGNERRARSTEDPPNDQPSDPGQFPCNFSHSVGNR